MSLIDRSNLAVGWPNPAATWRNITMAVAGLVVVTCVILNVIWIVDERGHAANDGAAKSAVAFAETALPDLLSYEYSSLEEYKVRLGKVATAEFRDELANLLESKIAPVAKREQIVTRSTVPALSVVDVKHKDHVVVLAYVNQVTRKANASQPLIEGSRLVVDLTRTGGAWRVAKLDPV